MSSAQSSSTVLPRTGQAVTEPRAGQAVSRPVPESSIHDPRKYQIEQVKKRYTATITNLQNGTSNLSFHLKPSDPDFPFSLEYLRCELQVPRSYPTTPTVLRVKNTDIPRGFAINIERGWDCLVAKQNRSTLLSAINALDRNLEELLSEKAAETIKLVSFKDTRHLDQTSSKQGEQETPSNTTVTAEPPLGQATPSRSYIFEESFSKDQIAYAKIRRAQEVQQLESRMGRMPLFQKSPDGIIYTLPLEPRRRSDLPRALQSVTSVQLIISLLYPLQPLRILLNDIESGDAEPLEEAFRVRATEQPQMTLMSHLNYLAQNLQILFKNNQAKAETKLAETAAIKPNTETKDSKGKGIAEDDRGHIEVIPRPPEWDCIEADEASDSVESDLSWDSEDKTDGGAAVVESNTLPPKPNKHAEHGTSISFPLVELHGIELLEVAILSINVKCGRCKTVNEITSLEPMTEKSNSCKKCATPFKVQFRPEPVHQNSIRAGFIDVSGCSVADMLPSTFIPTCGRCSTPSPGLVSIRGDAITNVCRECHSKFTFKIPEVKFLAITPGSAAPPSTGPKRRQEKLGLHAGEPLPDRGSCSHYKRSYRWFRFACCQKVHPCDKCHDVAEDHLNEWANRMICGWCSREQNYAVEACGFCGRSVIGKKGSGFWEGGKGTRDRTLMSRKDKRKFRRPGGAASAKKKD